MELLDWLARGLIELPWWGYAVFVLAVTHVSIASITIFLHRHQTHRALELHPVASHFFRFWLWLTTGTVTREWVAVHRRHHATVETPDDPHSPQVHGIWKVVGQGYELYRVGARARETLEKYGYGTPDDWLERNIYARHSYAGIFVLLAIDLAAFGAIGLTVWGVQMIWQPFFAAGIINGMGHWFGYRNFEVPDASTNIVPWALVIGGEELHNNHHVYPSSAKFSVRWWEADLGWIYIRTLALLGLATVKKTPPKPVMVPEKARVDLDTLKAIIANRFQIMSRYAKTVVARVHAEECRKSDAYARGVLRRAKSLLVREESLLSVEAQHKLERALAYSQALETVYEYKRKLQAIWQERTMSQESLLRALEDWCKQAEASGIRALQEFARTLPRYSLQAA